MANTADTSTVYIDFETGLEKLILLYISTFINSSSNFEIVHNNPKKKKNLLDGPSLNPWSS